MKHIKLSLVLTSLLLANSSVAATKITGAGSTFIYPVMSQWASLYAKNTGTIINYQPIGSGGGIEQISRKTVDFAATDVPLSLDQLNKNHWQQFPVVMGGIVLVVNIAGIQNNQLTLDGKTLADIYLGQVKYWNDPEIKTLNPNLNLPHNMIITVHRADGSGTTFNFTYYLGQINPNWKKNIGSDTVVAWPSFGLGAKGNAGVAAQVMNLPNSIGYVEYAYAQSNNMTMVNMVNAAGKTVSASAQSFSAAAQSANWQASNGFNLVLTNAAGDASWPIMASTFAVLPTQNNANLKAVQQFFTWAYANGNATANTLGYVAMPSSVVSDIEKQW